MTVAAVLSLALLAGVTLPWLARWTRRRRANRAVIARRAAIVESTHDAVIGESLDGVVTDWNRGAELMFGFTRAEALGCRIEDLIVAPAHHAEAATLRELARRGGGVPPFDSTRRHRDGSDIDVSITAAPIMLDGVCVGFSKSVRDVSEARRMQGALATMNARLEEQIAERTAQHAAIAHDLRSILDALPSMIGYWNKDLTNRVANQAYSRWFGVEPDGMRGRPMAELLGEEMFALNRPMAEAALRGEPQTFERRIPARAGIAARDSLAHYLPDVVDGEVRGFYVLVHDVTDLVESRRALAQAQRDHQALNDAVRQHAIVSVTDRAGRIVDVSDSFCEISQYSRGELIGARHDLVNSGVHPKKFWQEMWRTVATGHGWHGEVCNRAKDGSLYWVDSVICPFFGVDGKIDKYVSFRTDITARKRTEQELQSASTLLAAVLSAASESSFIATDRDGLITVFNRGAERLLGYTARELVGLSTPAQFHDPGELAARGEELGARYGTAITGYRSVVHEPEQGPAETREWTYLRKDGARIPVSLTVTVMRDDGGAVVGYLGIATDITRHKQDERTLREALHKAKHANRAKSQFLANMSHEIRTPMNAVIGLTYLLERTHLDPEQAGFLSKIRIASDSLLGIINDVLDLSKIEAAEMKLERAQFSPRELARDVVALLAVQAEAKGVALNLDIAVDVPAAVEGDVTRLRQVIANLVGNAVKFTERGAVEVRVRQLHGDTVTTGLQFAVKDTGIGISPDAIGKLFSPFVQADASTTRRFGGTGLGLSLVKQLVGIMGGRVTVGSIPGVGSEFTVELELPVSTLPVPVKTAGFVPSALASLRGIRILVADDSVLNLEVARRMLELEGATVRVATNGEEAVAALAADPAGIDVVLMDVHMPVLDGNDATRRIRNGLGLARLPIIALTAGALAVERAEAEAAGMTDFVSKPFELRALVATIRAHVGTVVGPAISRTITARPPAGWPEVEGIDARDVSRRLIGDVAMFEQLLRRLVDDFADLPALEALEQDALAKRMHHLKGTAGTLGARALQRAAEDCERACVDGDREDLHVSRRCVITGLVALREGVDAARWPEQRLDDREVPLDPTAIGALRATLLQANLGALEQFTKLAPMLRSGLGVDRFATLRKQVEDLQFEEAARALERLAS